MMASIPVNLVHISLLLLSAALLAASQQNQESEPKKNDSSIGKKYREQEPPFRPPPIPVKRRIQVQSGAEQPPSFFKSASTASTDKAEARQFLVEPLPFDQPFGQPPPNYIQEQPLQSGGFSDPREFQPRQENSFHQPRQQQNSFNQNPNSFQQFNQPQHPQQSQNFQQVQQQPQPQQQQQQQLQQRQQIPQGGFQNQNNNFQDQTNFQNSIQDLPTLPPVFIPPRTPQGPPPQLQSPIRNLFRQPDPPFSLAGLIQRFLNIFNFNN